MGWINLGIRLGILFMPGMTMKGSKSLEATRALRAMQ
jgi:hypothetical protein